MPLECPNATKAEKDALRKERITKAKRRSATRGRHARLPKREAPTSPKLGGNAVDDADAAAADRICLERHQR